MKINIKLSCFLLLTLFIMNCSSSKKSTNKSPQQPNIIFILVDDLGYADVGFNGATFYETPHLDALSKESLVFENSYMYPTCSPSRAALLTGKQSFRTDVYTVPVLEKGDKTENIFSRWTVGREHPIYAEPMEKAGYQSIHLGKWHIVGPYPEEELSQTFPFEQKLTQPDAGDYTWVEKHKTNKNVMQYYPEGRGFLKNVGGTFRGDPAFEEGGYKSEAGGYRAPFSNPFIEPKAGDEWLPDRLTDDAMDFMSIHKNAPFFVNLHYYTVHRPIKSRSDELYKKYEEKAKMHLTGKIKPKKKDKLIGYATMVENMDKNIGRLVEYLDKNNLRENTLIVFSSDNGVHSMVSHNYPLRGAKGQIYEGGVRVPTLMNWKGKIKTRRSVAPISSVDYFPTFMDLANINYSGQLDGESIVPLFSKEVRSLEERTIFWHLASRFKHGTCTAMRKGDYKLIQFLKNGKLELYNLKTDPKESDNLAKINTELAEELLKEMVNWRKNNNVPLPPNSILEY